LNEDLQDLHDKELSVAREGASMKQLDKTQGAVDACASALWTTFRWSWCWFHHLISSNLSQVHKNCQFGEILHRQYIKYHVCELLGGAQAERQPENIAWWRQKHISSYEYAYL